MVQNRTYLVVTKDIGGYQAIRPVANLLEHRRVGVVVVAEGLSLALWQKEGYIVFGGAPKEGQFDPKTLIRSDIDPAKILAEVKPDCVVATAGSPIGLERAVCLEANKQGIPVVVVNDIWGADQRLCGCRPDLICAIDSEDARLATVYYSTASRPYINETGSPAMDALADVKTDSTTEKMLEDRFSVLMLGQDACTTPMLKGLIQALEQSGDDFVLIPRLHPKILDGRAEWLEMLSRVKGDVLQVCPSVTTRQLMRSVRHVVSVYSTGLIEAAFLGSMPISWVSDVGREMMRRNLGGVEQFSLVGQGCCYEVSSPEEYLQIPRQLTAEFSAKVAANLKNDGHSAGRVVQAIHDYIDINV